jgi:hypothetical protein
MSSPPIFNVHPACDGATVPDLAHTLPPVVRRRSTPQQGLAIQMLGNAVDHLLRSRMFLIDEPPSQADADAIHILMRLKRTVFSECAQVTEDSRSLRQWMMQALDQTTN